MALSAVSDALRGYDAAAIEAAWHAYLEEAGKSATDLGHWLMGQDLRGGQRDYGTLAFDVLAAKAEKAAASTVAGHTGVKVQHLPAMAGMPAEWQGVASGVQTTTLPVPPDATEAEALAAWTAMLAET